MADRTLLRIGAVLSVVGAVIVIVGWLLHGGDFGDFREGHLALAVDSRLWVVDHLALLFGDLLIVGGLVALYRSITTDPGAALARLGFAASLIAGSTLVVSVAIDGIALKEAAETWAGAPAADKAAAFYAADAINRVNWAVFSLLIILFRGVMMFLFGLAVGLSDVYPRWLGWALAISGIGGAGVGLTQILAGPSELVSVAIFAVIALAQTAWVLIIGVLMWRRASSTEPVSAIRRTAR